MEIKLGVITLFYVLDDKVLIAQHAAMSLKMIFKMLIRFYMMVEVLISFFLHFHSLIH